MDQKRRKSMGDELTGGVTLLQALFERRPSAMAQSVAHFPSQQASVFSSEYQRQQQLQTPAPVQLYTQQGYQPQPSHPPPDAEAPRQVPGSPDSMPDITAASLYAGDASATSQNWTPNYSCTEFTALQSYQNSASLSGQHVNTQLLSSSLPFPSIQQRASFGQELTATQQFANHNPAATFPMAQHQPNSGFGKSPSPHALVSSGNPRMSAIQHSGEQAAVSFTANIGNHQGQLTSQPEQTRTSYMNQTQQMDWPSSSGHGGIQSFPPVQTSFTHQRHTEMSARSPASSLPRFGPQRTGNGYSEVAGWKNKHPCAWSPADCILWFRSVAQDCGLDASCLNLQEFVGLNGATLTRMGSIDFLEKDKEYGSMWYSALHQVLARASADVGTFVPKIEPTDSYSYGDSGFQFLSAVNSAGPVAPDMAEYLQEHYANDEFDDIDVDMDSAAFLGPCQGYQQSTGTTQMQYYQSGYSTQSYPDNCNASLNSDGLDYKSDMDSDTDRSCNNSTYSTTPDLSGGRAVYSYGSYSPAAGSSTSADSTPPRQVRTRAKPEKTKNRSKHGTKGNHLWEFIRDLLKDKQFKIIKWENKEEGVFRFVESETVAKMWGDRKSNPRMTYEKLSRAMRTYYESKILVQVPKTGQYPKKLVYQFGPDALKTLGNQ